MVNMEVMEMGMVKEKRKVLVSLDKCNGIDTIKKKELRKTIAAVLQCQVLKLEILQVVMNLRRHPGR